MTVSKFRPITETGSPAPYYRAAGREAETVLAAARRGAPVLLKGPTGCGKIRFVEAMAHETGRELITVAGHEDMTSADLVGRFLLKGGETVWVDGPLTRAVREGAICYLDEIVEARQDTTVVIHPLADHRRELSIDRLGTTVYSSEMDDDDDGPAEKSWILKLFEVPLGMQAPAKFLRTLFGGSRSPGSEGAGGELGVGSIRRTSHAGVNARPVPTAIRFTGAEKPGAALEVGGAMYPEWDVFGDRYREDWCRVVDFPITAVVDVSAVGAARDAVLRRRLARVGLGPKVLRARADGDDVDVEALIDLFTDLCSGHSPPEHVYLERRKLARNLGVLILVDASGSATDADGDGLAIHDHQRRAAATLGELSPRMDELFLSALAELAAPTSPPRLRFMA